MEYPIFRDVDNFIIRVNQEREKTKKATYIVDYMVHYTIKGTFEANRQVLQCHDLLGRNFRRLTSMNHINLAFEINRLIDFNIRDYNLYLEIAQNSLKKMTQEQEQEQVVYKRIKLHNTKELLRKRIQDLERILRELDRSKDVVLNTLSNIQEYNNRPVLSTKCIKKTEIKTNEECSVCLDDNISTRNMWWFNCNHGVCASCITRLLITSNNKCPLCRKQINKVCVKYTRSECTKEYIMRAEVSRNLLNSVCR